MKKMTRDERRNHVMALTGFLMEERHLKPQDVVQIIVEALITTFPSLWLAHGTAPLDIIPNVVDLCRAMEKDMVNTLENDAAKEAQDAVLRMARAGRMPPAPEGL